MQYKQFWILTLCLLFSHAYADHAENQTNCERLGGTYALDKKNSSWGCYRLSYLISDHEDTSANRKKCEYDNKLYGWNGSQYDCFFSKKINLQVNNAQNTLADSPASYQNATLNQRAVCEDNGNAFIWDQEKNEWKCQKLIYRTVDKRENLYNRQLCENQGNKYEWDGQYYCCITTKPSNKRSSLTPANETLQLREKCEKNGDLFRWNDTANKWECMSMQVVQKPNETLIRRETCEKEKNQFTWNGTKNEWECISNQTVLERDALEQRKQACLRFNKAFEWNLKQKDWECIATEKSERLPSVGYNEAQEKRAVCEQRGLIYTWNGNTNQWECFNKIEKYSDEVNNKEHELQCSAQGNNYLETDKKWQCLKLVKAPEKKQIDNAKLTKICQNHNGSLKWMNSRWICMTKSTKEDIEKAQIPSFKSSAPTVQQQPKLLIDNQKTEYILYFGLTDDGKYFTTYSAAAQNYITRIYNLSNMEQTYSISRNITDGSTLHKGLLFLHGNYNSPFEVIDLIHKKSLLLLQGTQVHELAMTNDDSLLLLIDNKRNIIAIDTKIWEKRYTIPTRRIHLDRDTLLDISKPFFYENIDGQQAALDIKTGKEIMPLPVEPPRYGNKIEKSVPATLPLELNASKGELFFSTDFHYAIETEKGFFHIWDLTKKVKLYTHEGRIENSFTRIKTTNTHAIFHASQSTYLLDFRNPSLLKQLTYSTDKANNYSQLKSSSLLETGGRISWDLENATAVQQKDRVSQIDSIENKAFALFRQNIKSLRRLSSSIRQIELSPDKSKIIAAVDSGHEIMMWDINKSALDYTIQNQTQFVLTPDSDYIITLSYTPTSEDGPPPEHDLNIWNYKTGTLERTLPKRAMTFTLIPNSSLIALGENDGTISIWDYRNGLERYRLIGHETSIYKLEVLPNNYQLLSQDREGTTILWDHINNTPVGKKQWHRIHNKVLISPDSNYMLLIDSQYKKQEAVIRLLNLKTSQYEYEFSGSYGTTWGFSPNSKRLYLATPEGATKVYETATGKELAILHAFDNGEWIILTPQGYFNASPKGREFILDSSSKPIEDEIYKKYYSPEKVKEILNPKEKK